MLGPDADLIPPASAPDAKFLTIGTTLDGDSFVIALDGELDLSTVPAVEAALFAAEAGCAKRIVLDLSALRFIDSTGIGMVLRARHLPFVD